MGGSSLKLQKSRQQARRLRKEIALNVAQAELMKIVVSWRLRLCRLSLVHYPKYQEDTEAIKRRTGYHRLRRWAPRLKFSASLWGLRQQEQGVSINRASLWTCQGVRKLEEEGANRSLTYQRDSST
mmetsp:Transcript_30552/g.76284  ORF Transcript_30552/g.76284 Transcript_30552/m.76284 type:complete len:126 (+) Transcript_30552:1377-1754(+)